MIHFFTGEYNGTQFIGARAASHDERIQHRAGFVVDSLTDASGSRIPQLNKNRCVIRRLSSSMVAQNVEAILGSVPDSRVHHVGTVALDQLEPYFAEKELDKSLQVGRELALEEADLAVAS